MFDELTEKSVGYYVYMLVDPRNSKPFYVGKGKGNRVFQHIEDAKRMPNVHSDKLDTIREIGPEKVQHVILTHGIDTETEVYKMEAAIIDALNYLGYGLTNEVSGHHAAETGCMTTEEIIRLYHAERLERIEDNCAVININGQYSRSMGHDAIYKATKEAWRIGKRRLGSIKYVLSEYRGLIVEVFEVERWYEVTRTYGPLKQKAGQTYIAYGFEGKVANESVRSLYINKSIADRKVRGRANPISYAESINTKEKQYGAISTL